MSNSLRTDDFDTAAKFLVSVDTIAESDDRSRRIRMAMDLIARARRAAACSGLRLFCDGLRLGRAPRSYCDPVRVDRATAAAHVHAGLISPVAADQLYEIRDHPAIEAIYRDRLPTADVSSVPVSEMIAITRDLTEVVQGWCPALYFAFDSLPSAGLK